MIPNTHSDNIKLFSAFKKALLTLAQKDRSLLENRKKRASISHRLALYLEQLVPYVKFVDLYYEVKLKGKDIYPDILLHDRFENIQLGIFWQEGYLSKAEQEEVKRFHEETKAGLTLAFSILPDKPYFLIYRVEDNLVQYLHINKENGYAEYLKQVEEDIVKEEPQLFHIPKKRRKQNKKNVETKEESTSQQTE